MTKEPVVQETYLDGDVELGEAYDYAVTAVDKAQHRMKAPFLRRLESNISIDERERVKEGEVTRCIFLSTGIISFIANSFPSMRLQNRSGHPFISTATKRWSDITPF